MSNCAVCDACPILPTCPFEVCSPLVDRIQCETERQYIWRLPKERTLFLSLRNVGAGKTEDNLKFIAANPQKRFIVVVPNYRNVYEYVARLQGYDVRCFVFRGKGPVGSGENAQEALCCRFEGEQYAPGCKTCPHFLGKEHEGCPYLAQYPEKDEWRVVVTTAKSIYAVMTGVPFNWMIIDESVDDILYSMKDFSRADYAAMGIECDVFPTPVRRMCDTTCPLFEHCIDRNNRDVKATGRCKGHSTIVHVTPTITRKPENDWEYFLHASLKDHDGDVVTRLAAWDFYLKKPNLLLFGFLPEFPVIDGIRFASATVTEQMAKEWFFANYCEGWKIEVDPQRQIPFPNEVVTTHRRGSRKSTLQALRDGSCAQMLNDLDKIPDRDMLLVGVQKQEEEIKKHFPNANVDHFPLLGVDCYRNVHTVVILTPYRFPQSVRYLLSAKIGWGLVRVMEAGVEMQAIGRIRPLDDPSKLIVCNFDFEHELFPNTTFQKELRTKEWVRMYLTDDYEARIEDLFVIAKNVNRDLAIRDYNEFCQIVKRVRETLPIPLSECPPLPEKFCLLNYLADPHLIKKNDLKKEKDGGRGLFGKYMGLWQIRRYNYMSGEFDATVPYFIATGRQPVPGKRGAKAGKILIVIDLDGQGDYRLWQAERHMPPTMAVRTGSGGTQLYYYTPTAISNGAAFPGTCGFEHVDIRGDGGIVFGPGTHWADKHEYTIIEGGFDTITTVSEAQFWNAVNVEKVEVEIAGKKQKVVRPKKAWDGTRKGQLVPFTTPYPPCVIAAMEYGAGKLRDTSSHGMAHDKRVFLASYLLKAKMPFEVVVQKFAGTNDFTTEDTGKQVKSCKKLKLIHACITVAMMSLCDPKCPHCSKGVP